MEDQYAIPGVLSGVSDDDNESSMDTGDDDHFNDDERTPNTPGGSSQNEGGLHGYTSPQETSPDYEIHEEVIYHDESHQGQSPETPAPWQATAAIDDNFKHISTLGKRVERLNDEQALLNEWQEHVHSEARQIVADAAKHASQDILPQLEKMKDELMESHQLLKKLTSPQLKNAVTRASQSPLGEDTEKDALQRHLSGALQALDTACKALHGIQTQAQECPCREMQPAASYEEQNNTLTVPLSACPDAAAIGNGRTNDSSLTGEFNNFNFNSADAGNNNMDTLLSSLHLPTADNGNEIMTSNTGRFFPPCQGGATSRLPTPFDTLEMQVASHDFLGEYGM